MKYKAITILAASLSLLGCGQEPPPPKKPNFEDRKVPAPQVSNIPNALNLTKGDADVAIEKSFEYIKDDLDVAQKLRLRTLLTGYVNWEEYVYATKLTDSHKVATYAQDGEYNTQTNTFDFKGVLDGNLKKKIFTTPLKA